MLSKMIDKKVIPLYITDSLAALDALAQKEDIFKYFKKTHRFASIVAKMKVELLMCREDQEKCYILAKRYVLLMDHLFKITDDLKYTRAIYLNDYNTVKELMNTLRNDLEERYAVLTEVLRDKLSIRTSSGSGQSGPSGRSGPSSESGPSGRSGPSSESGSQTAIAEQGYILPTGGNDPLLEAEKKLEEEFEIDREIRGPAQVSPTASREIFISPQGVHEMLEREEYILLVDIRPAEDYEECKIKVNSRDNSINIPVDLIRPGLSANTLGNRLAAEIRVIWERRDQYDSIIMMDYNTCRYNYFSSKLERLRSYIVEWDYNRTYKQLPFILDGGIKEFVEWYPSQVDNPTFIYLKTNCEIDELLDLDNIEYPGSGIGFHRNLRIDSAYSMENLPMRIDRDFGDDDDADEDALALRAIRSEGALPKDSYQLKDLGLPGPFTSISEQRLHKEYKDENINPNTSTDFIIPKNEISLEDVKAIREAAVSEQEELLRKARLLKPVELPEKWTEIGGSSADTLSSVPSLPPIDRSFKPTRVQKPDGEDKRHGYTGILNYKNSCFMSCILQCMKVVPMLKEFYVLSNQYVIHNRRVPSVFNIAMGPIFTKLWEGTEDNPKIYRPNALRDKISKVNRMYQAGNHEDAFEFFLFFFNTLNEDCIVDMPRPPVMTESEQAWYSALQGRSSYLIDSFFYQLRNSRVCYRCTKSTSTYETEGMLNLSMRSLEPCRLEELMHDYLGDYLVSDFSCQGCNSTMTIVNKRRVVVEPEVLVIALKRYICNEDGTIKKHEGEVMFPDDGLQFGRSVYKLYAVAQHEGAVSAGHYYATCLLDAARDDWVEFNDTTMTKITLRPLQTPILMRTSAVGFFYIRQQILDDPVKDFD